MKLAPQYILESQDEFLALFRHRFDYIWAEHSPVGQTPEWRTERRHPLSDRLIQQGSYLYGVRFGAETQYCLLDIDRGSPYHPQHDPFAIARIIAALEPLGLVNYLATTSSYSGGLHLYLPFSQAQSSWKLAIALACLLENAGFKPVPGQLEVFPNPKPYTGEKTLGLFNAHRLPLQSGSYLLNAELQPIWSDQERFVQHWQWVQDRNDVDRSRLKRIVNQAKRKHFQISGKADKFINDLNAEIELGWTGSGQTNRLLGRITLRAYIFHHTLSGGEPLEGRSLVQEIVETAKSLPGYQDYCRHQHEIEHRAAEWALCIENSHYFPYGNPKGKFKPRQPELEAAIDCAPSWNQQQSQTTRDRIRSAIADLLEKQALPAKATARFQSLLTYKIGGASLYRHRDLWHPQSLMAEVSNAALDPVSSADLKGLDSQFKQPTEYQNIPSLLSAIGGNVWTDKDSGMQVAQLQLASGSNLLAETISTDLEDNLEANLEPQNQAQRSLDGSVSGMIAGQTTPPACMPADDPDSIVQAAPEFKWTAQIRYLLALGAPFWVWWWGRLHRREFQLQSVLHEMEEGTEEGTEEGRDLLEKNFSDRDQLGTQ